MRRKNVAVPPRDPGAFLRIFKHRLISLTDTLYTIRSIVEKAGHETISDVFHDVRSSKGWSVDVEQAVSLAAPDKSLVDATTSTVDLALTDKLNPAREIERLLGYLDELLERLSWDEVKVAVEALTEQYSVAEAGFIDVYEYDPKLLSIEDFTRVMTLPRVVVDLTYLLTEARSKLEVQLYLMTHHRLPYEEVETLYHASTQARQLYEGGFDPAGARSKRGIGQFGGALPQTSFTADEEMAEEIAQALLEVVLIARGEINAEELLQHAADDGVLEKTISLYHVIEGESPVGGSPGQTFNLYRAYLAAADEAGKRFDPLFVGMDVEAFVDVEPGDVGWLECQVRMKPEAEYLHVMREFRVDPRDILSCPRWHRATTPWR